MSISGASRRTAAAGRRLLERSLRATLRSRIKETRYLMNAQALLWDGNLLCGRLVALRSRVSSLLHRRPAAAACDCRPVRPITITSSSPLCRAALHCAATRNKLNSSLRSTRCTVHVHESFISENTARRFLDHLSAPSCDTAEPSTPRQLGPLSCPAARIASRRTALTLICET